MKFEFLTGDCDWVSYGGIWVSPKLEAGGFNYWVAIRFDNMEDLGCDDDGKYMVTVCAVAPGLLEEEEMQSILRQLDEQWWVGMSPEYQDLVLVEEVLMYGSYAPVWTKTGNNYRKLMQDARAVGNNVAKYPWSYFNQTANALGSSMLDFMHGDMLAGLYGRTRTSETHEPYLQNTIVLFTKEA